MLSTDKKIFEINSPVRERMVEYGGLAEELHIVLLCRGRARFKEEKIGNVFLYVTNSAGRLWSVLGAVKIGRSIIAKNSGYWLVTAQDPFETGWAGWQIAKKFSLPLQLQIHTDFLSPYFSQGSFLNKLRVSIARRTLARANGIRVVSERIKKSLLASGIRLKTEPLVLPVFVDIKKIRSSPIKIDLKQKYPQFDSVILMASRLTREKNVFLAIEAMAEILKIFSKVGLIIVGEGPVREKLKAKIYDLGLEASVIFEPWNNDLVSYLKTADLFVISSNYEGTSMAMIEAMSVGCPLVITDVSGTDDIIKDKISALVVLVGDVSALKEAILYLLADRTRAKTLGENAAAAVADLPGKDDYLQKYKKSWEDILEPKK